MKYSGKKYIYNPEQANFFIQNGCLCTGTGINPSTGKVYWQFNYNDVQTAYQEWIEKCKDNK